jgi:hypothetical protein
VLDIFNNFAKSYSKDDRVPRQNLPDMIRDMLQVAVEPEFIQNYREENFFEALNNFLRGVASANSGADVRMCVGVFEKARCMNETGGQTRLVPGFSERSGP